MTPGQPVRNVGWAVTTAMLLSLGAFAPTAGAAEPVFDRVPLDSGVSDPRNVAISADGWTVVYDAAVGVTANVGARQVYAYSRRTHTTVLVSTSAGGSPGDQSSTFPTVDGNGRHVAFQSDSTNLVPGDTNVATDVFVRDLTTRQTGRASVHRDGRQVQGTWPGQSPRIDSSGRYLFFISWGDLGGPSVTGPVLYRLDLRRYALQRVSLTERGQVPAGGASDAYGPHAYAISSDGRFVAFRSTFPLTADAPFCCGQQLYWRDITKGTVRRLRNTGTRLDANDTGVLGARTGEWNNTTEVAVDASGRYVAATLPLEVQGLQPSQYSPTTLYLIDTLTGSTTTADSRSGEPLPVQVNPAFGPNAGALIFAAGPVTPPTGRGLARSGLYSRDRVSGVLTDLTTPASCLGATCQAGTSNNPAVASGGAIAFLTDVPFVAGDTDTGVDIYVRS
jgi:hypothetical protein